MRKPSILAIGIALAAPVAAHDFWLQPRSFAMPTSRPLPLTVFVGHGPDRQRWGVGADHVIQFVSIGPRGKADRRGELTLGGFGVDGVVHLDEPGTHLLVMQTTASPSDLPSVRYNSYAQAEGLSIPLRARARQGRSATNGRELYSRRAKAIVQIGPLDPGQAALATRRLGLSLELVPDRHPLSVQPGAPLGVTIYFEGRRLPGATVKLTNLDADAVPVEVHLSDRNGHAEFAAPGKGRWLVNTIWSVPTPNTAIADYRTIFSSLTFGYPETAN